MGKQRCVLCNPPKGRLLLFTVLALVIAVPIIFVVTSPPSNFTKQLNVPLIYQFNDKACGCACLEMVYRYYNMTDVTQEEIFNTYKFELNGTYRVRDASLVDDAQYRGFHSSTCGFLGIVNLGQQSVVVEKLVAFIEDGIPIIVSQWYSLTDKALHCRVVTAVSNDSICVNDPIDGNKVMSVTYFIQLWNGTCGFYIAIQK